MRTMTLLFCLTLVSCAGANAAHQTPEPMASAEPAQASPHARVAAAKPKKDEKSEEWWKDGGVTREKINAMCWMKFEQDRKDLKDLKDLNIDKRADLVNDCVTQTLKVHPIQ